MRSLTFMWLCVLGPSVACATAEDLSGEDIVLGADGVDASAGGVSFGPAPAAGGNLASGGDGAGGAAVPPPGAGGAPATGGAPTPVASGGAPASAGGAPIGVPGAGGGGAVACGAGQKLCSGTCVAPVPTNGCGDPSCTPCPPSPANGYASCKGGQCGIDCYLGYVVSGNTCQPQGGGAGGGVGVGGAPGQCNAAACPACLLGATPCCKPTAQCGCQLLILPCG